MKITIGSDHAGFRYKEMIKRYLAESGHEVIDFGTDSEAPVDYPLFIRPVALAVAAGEAERCEPCEGSALRSVLERRDCATRAPAQRCQCNLAGRANAI